MGDPQSPIRASEIFRYLAVDLLSEGVGAILDLVNTHLLTGRGGGDVASKHQSDLIKKALADAAAHPNGAPKNQPIGVWGGPVFGGSIQASRSVNTGTYYGSDSKVQLIDSLGISAAVGFMGGLDGLGPVIPSISANLFVQRSYLHIRPITEMKQGINDSWLNLWVPRFFSHFEKILGKAGDDGALSSESATPVLSELGEKLEEGESFVIGDTVGASVGAGFAIPLPLLLDAGIGVFSPSIGVSLSAQPALLRRIIITRTSTGLQITVQDSKSLSLQVGANLNWVVRLASLTTLAKTGVADSSVFNFDFGTMDPERRPALVRSLRGIFRKNNPEILENEFPYFHLHHATNTSIDLSRLLIWMRRILIEVPLRSAVALKAPGHLE
jgi:hypothetical protein